MTTIALPALLFTASLAAASANRAAPFSLVMRSR
jgi:hypothetical protein